MAPIDNFIRRELTPLSNELSPDFMGDSNGNLSRLESGKSDELAIPKPTAGLQFSVVVPVKDEEESLPRLVRALARQYEISGAALDPHRYEIILLLNNCQDGSSAVAQELQRQYPLLHLHVAEIILNREEAHVGRARQLLFHTAAQRLNQNSAMNGIILTTDADTLPAFDWIAQVEREIKLGVEGVGGRITLFAEELAQLPARVRRYFLLDIGYRRALEEMRDLYAPDPHDPFPRHHQHFGGNMAVTAKAYTAAGGMPLVRSSEDVALYRAILGSGGKFRHSYRVRASTSARLCGRASGGLADALQWWNQKSCRQDEVRVESADAAERRLATLGLHRQRFPAGMLPLNLLSPPETPQPGEEEAVPRALLRLRERNARLRCLTWEERLQCALERLEIVLP